MQGEGARSTFEDLRDQGIQAIEAGRIEEAVALFDRALVWAQEHGDGRQIDLAVCNRAAAAIDLGRGEGELPRLREILMRNGDAVNCRVAAYNIARYYELAKSYKKALFYARIARERSESLDRRDWLASSYNLIGNTLLAESFVEQASNEYEQALALMPEEPSVAWAGILDNLGYCRILQRRYREGYDLLYRSLRLMVQLGNEQHEATVRLDLCFAHLETGRIRNARHQGTRALWLADRLGNSRLIKNALYLVGEVESLAGNVAAARAHFTRLQREFFPEASYLPGFLMAVDVRNLVNLHA